MADTGPGLAPEALAHLFEPFFTTKPDGTGLGLAIAREIALAHRGELRAEPGRDGDGAPSSSAFQPPRATTNASEPATMSNALRAERSSWPTTTGRSAATSSASLQAEGYRIVEADDGDDALAAFRATSRPTPSCST